MGRYTRSTGWGLIRLPHARDLDDEIDKELKKIVDETQDASPSPSRTPASAPPPGEVRGYEPYSDFDHWTIVHTPGFPPHGSALDLWADEIRQHLVHFPPVEHRLPVNLWIQMPTDFEDARTTFAEYLDAVRAQLQTALPESSSPVPQQKHRQSKSSRTSKDEHDDVEP
jgi:hypothetical protein